MLNRAVHGLDEIANWTPYQLRMMLADEKELGGTMRMSPEAARGVRSQRSEERERFVDGILNKAKVWKGRIGR